MKNIAIAIHGGGGEDSEFIRQHLKEYQNSLHEIITAGYNVLKKRGTAVDAVEKVVNMLEDNPLFNAGRGAALNAKGEVEMCSSIMEGKTRASGAVAILKYVKNPVSLARKIMEKTKFSYLGGPGALNYAKEIELPLRPEAYFITEHQYDEFEKAKKKKSENITKLAKEEINERMHGTVGAVALDSSGCIAAATSTGGTVNCKEGRIGDSSMIGVGTYADNSTCAVSSTGDGEYLIRSVTAYSVSAVMKYGKLSLSEACDFIIHTENKDIKGDMGVIALNTKGEIAISFNCERMHRAWIKEGEPMQIKIYK
jgi:beta-aspartyl-peptidase (threonine type)